MLFLSAIGANAEEINDPKYPFHPTINLSFTSSNLPIVILDLDERMADKEDDKRVLANMKIIWNKNGERNDITDIDNYDYDGKIKIKYRGNTSFNDSDKKPFAVRTVDDNEKKLSVSILGMGIDNDWVLLAPFHDHSMIRDILLFDLMRETFDYTPAGRYCEVILNGIYQGVYIMTERVRQGSNRVDIDKPSSDEGDNLTGGYHLEIDGADSPGFWGKQESKDLWGNDLNNYTFYQFKYPELEDLSDKQIDYIKSKVWDMETTIAGDNFKDPDMGFRAYIDTCSLANLYIAQELTRNVDAYRRSTPFYKYKDSTDKRFKFSVWDFNFSSGVAGYLNAWGTEGWAWNNNIEPQAHPVPWMFKRILQDEVFYSSLKRQWKDYRKERLSDEKISSTIDSLTTLLQESQERNFSTWDIFGRPIWPNYYEASSWDDAINYLRNWITSRAAWIDSQWDNDNVNYVSNGSFEANTYRSNDDNADIFLADWNTEGYFGLSTNQSNSGEFALGITNKSSVNQIITEIKEGYYYNLSFKSKTISDPDANVYVKYYDEETNRITEITKPISYSNTFSDQTITDIPIKGVNVAEIGFRTAAKNNTSHLFIDDIEFIEGDKIPQSIIPDVSEFNIYVNSKMLSILIETGANKITPIEIFHISGKSIYSSSFQESIMIERIFAPNQVYILNIDGVRKKILF